MSDLISRQDTIDALCSVFAFTPTQLDMRSDCIDIIERMPSAQPEEKEIKEIGYADCANALLKMWMDNVLCDMEYKRIIGKLNRYWKK